MDIDDILLFIINASSDGIHGKTAMQKIAYFVSIFLKQDMGFYAHYYGPYSKEVDINLKILDDFSFIDSKMVRTKFNKLMPIFNLNDDGEEIVASLKNVYENEYSIIDKVIKLCECEGMDYNVLSYAAKIHYILSEDKRVSHNKIIELADRYGWKLSHDDIEVAKRLLLSLGLITVYEKKHN